MPLFAAGLAALVIAKLLATEAFEGFPLPASMAEDTLLLVAQMLAAHEFVLQFLALGEQQTFRSLEKREFRAGGASGEELRRESLGLADAAVNLFQPVAHPGDLLVGRSQAQLLLMFDALAEVKKRLQGETKRHNCQLGKARSFAMLSEKETLSPGFCMRNRFRSGIMASALSSVGSPPF